MSSSSAPSPTPSPASPSRGNVTRSTFSTELADFKEQLRTCAFAAIDEEFTGISFDKVDLPPPAFQAVFDQLSSSSSSSSHGGRPGMAIPHVFHADRWSDRPDERYERMRVVASTYSIIQLGVCLFHVDDDASSAAAASSSASSATSSPIARRRYVARPYTFWLFPSNGLMCLQSDTVDFLCKHGMDFNTWLHQGVRFVNRDEAARLRATIFNEASSSSSSNKSSGSNSNNNNKSGKGKNNKGGRNGKGKSNNSSNSSNNNSNNRGNNSSEPMVLRQPQDEQFVAAELDRLREWYDSLVQSTPTSTSSPSTPSSSSSSSSSSPSPEDAVQDASIEGTSSDEFHEFHFTPCNSFLRLALRQHASAAFPDLLIDLALPDPTSSTAPPSMPPTHLRLAAYHVPTQRARARYDCVRHAVRVAEYTKAIGALGVFEALVAARKPLVGHHCMFDFVYLMSHFASLPAAYVDFKDYLHALFPLLYDTRFLCTRPALAWKRSTNVAGADADAAAGADATVDALPPQSSASSTSFIRRFPENHLQHLYNTLQDEERALALEQPLVRIADGFDSFSATSSKAHDAAFDAFMTGYVFAHFHAEQPERIPLVPDARAGATAVAVPVATSSPSTFANTFQLFSNIYAVRLGRDRDMTLDGEFVLFDGLPESCRSQHIRAFLGNLASNFLVQIYWSKTQALALLTPRPLAGEAPAETTTEQREELRAAIREWKSWFWPPLSSSSSSPEPRESNTQRVHRLMRERQPPDDESSAAIEFHHLDLRSTSVRVLDEAVAVRVRGSFA